MLFQFGLRSSLLLPFVVPGAAAALWLLTRTARRGAPADALLALLIAVPTLSVSQWMLGYAGWFDSHDRHSTFMFYVPWRAIWLLGPAYYLYFRSLTNQEFRWRQAGRHLLPGLLELGAFAAVATYDLVWWRGIRGRALPDFYGTKGAAATAFDEWYLLESLLGYALLLGYGLRMLADYRRYRRYLNDNFSDPERLRFDGLRQLLVLQALVLTLGLVFTVLNQVYDFNYDTSWYFFALRGLLIYGLIVVGLQANYAAATSSLRFQPDTEAPDVVSEPSLLAVGVEVPTVGTVLPTVGTVLPTVGTVLPTVGSPLSPVGTDVATVGTDVATVGTDVATVGTDVVTVGSLLPTVGSPLPTVGTVLPAVGNLSAALAPELLPWREKLLRLMADEQPWLEPELTLSQLAQRLRTNAPLVSRVINTGCGQNFNDFVNTYRVAEARRKLADPRFAHYSLVGVALESGFNSKSTFNRVFKKLAGHAPGEVARA